MFWSVAVLTHNLYYQRNGHTSDRKTIPGNQLNTWVSSLFFLFFALEQKLLARSEMRTRAWEKGMTVDTNSLRYLPRRSGRIAACSLRTATDRQTDRLRDFAKIKNSKKIFLGQSSQNSPKQVLIFWSSIPCVFCLYTLLKVVGYYDLSVLSMSVMGFQKKSLSTIQVFFGIFEIF